MEIAILFGQSDAENSKRTVVSRRAVVGAWLRRWRGGRGVRMHWLAAAAKAGLALLLEATAAVRGRRRGCVRPRHAREDRREDRVSPTDA